MPKFNDKKLMRAPASKTAAGSLQAKQSRIGRREADPVSTVKLMNKNALRTRLGLK